MTDARLRGEWLGALRWDDLSDTAWRVFTGALMWCNENGTDGYIPDRYLKALHPDGRNDAAQTELLRKEVWQRADGGYRLIDWAGALGQSTADEVDAYRTKNRERQRRFREKQRVKASASAKVGFDQSERDETQNVTRYGTRDVTAVVGTGLGTGQAQDNGTDFDSEKLEPELRSDDPSPAGPVMSWTVAVIPKTVRCAVPGCDVDVSDYPASAGGVCARQDAAHQQARASSSWRASA